MKNTDFYFESAILNTTRSLLIEKNLKEIIIKPHRGRNRRFKIIDVTIKTGYGRKELKEIEYESS